MTIGLTYQQVDRGPDKKQLATYFRTAIEREKMRRLRAKGAGQPWTSDPILREHRFCNVYREQDKVTIWLRENWREPFADHPNLPFAMALARLINWPPTLEEIGFPKRWRPDRVEDILLERKSLGDKVYTGAYLLGAVPAGLPRQTYLVRDVLTPLYKDLKNRKGMVLRHDGIMDSLEVSWQWFRDRRGIGDFLAYEIVSDLRHTKYLNKAPDVNTWANPGPGALRGLTRLWGYQPRTQRIKGDDSFNFPKKLALDAMLDLILWSQQKLPKWMPLWEMREVEHWLCEFDKYERIRLGQGVLEKFKPKLTGEW